jgi:adenylate kinase family enzyme
VLGPDDPLPPGLRRVLVGGGSGVGKSTLAVRIGRMLDLPYTELDSLFHGPGWTPRDEFEADVEALIAAPAWVTEWQYSPVRSRLAERADLMVVLDPGRLIAMTQVTGRTLRRRIRRQELWNGNFEAPLRTILTDREHIIRWAWSSYGRSLAHAAQLSRDRPDLTVVWLRSRPEVARWLAGPLAAVAP